MFLDDIKYLKIRLTVEQQLACLYLEAYGQRFCVDFGYENAVEKARQHWRSRRRRK